METRPQRFSQDKTRNDALPRELNARKMQFKFSIFHRKVCAILKQFLGTFITTGMPLVSRNE